MGSRIGPTSRRTRRSADLIAHLCMGQSNVQLKYGRTYRNKTASESELEEKDYRVTVVADN